MDVTPFTEGNQDGSETGEGDLEESSMDLAPSLLNLFDAVISRETTEDGPDLLADLHRDRFEDHHEDCLAKDICKDTKEEDLETEDAEKCNNNFVGESVREPSEGRTDDSHDVGTGVFSGDEGRTSGHGEQSDTENGNTPVDTPDGTCKKVISRTQKNSHRRNGQFDDRPAERKERPASAEILIKEGSIVTETQAAVEDAVPLRYRKSSRINPPMINLAVNSPQSSPPPSPPATPRIPNHGGSYLDHIVQEVVATEYKYVRDLSAIVIAYMEPMRKNGYSPLSEDKFNTLFCNLRDIYCFNRDFLGDLEQCNNNPVYVAECFLECEESFSVYTTYCTNYPEAVKLLTECANDDVISRYFREVQSDIGHGLPLGAYLLKPVQRILKYHLLFQNMCKHYNSEAEGYDTIIDALESMMDIARHINEMKRKHEAAIHVQEIQSQIHGMEELQENITSYGDLVLEDTFRMRRAERYLYLFEKALLICKKDDAELIFKACVKCSNLMLIENVPKEPLAFNIVLFDQQNVQHTIMARSMEQKKRWTHEIKRLIIENYTRDIPDNIKERILKAITPQDDADQGSPNTSTDLGRNRKFRKSGRRGRRNSEPVAKQLLRGQKQVKAVVENFLTGMKRPDLSKLGRAVSDGASTSADELLDHDKSDLTNEQLEIPETCDEGSPVTTITVDEDAAGIRPVHSNSLSPTFGLGHDSKRDSGIGSMTITEVQKPEASDVGGVGSSTKEKESVTEDDPSTTGQLHARTDKGDESPDELEVLENLSEEDEQTSVRSKENVHAAFKLRRADMKHYRRMLKQSEAIWEKKSEDNFRERSSSNSLPRSSVPPQTTRPHTLLTRTVSEGVCSLGMGPRSRKLSYSDSNIALERSSSEEDDSGSKDSSSSSLVESKVLDENQVETIEVQEDSDDTEDTSRAVVAGDNSSANIGGGRDDSEDDEAPNEVTGTEETNAKDLQVVEVPITATPHRVFSLARKFSVMAKEHQRPSTFRNVRKMKEESLRRNHLKASASSKNCEPSHPSQDSSNSEADSESYRRTGKSRRSSKSDPFAERDGTRSIVTVSANRDGTASVMTNPEGSHRLSRSDLWRQRSQPTVSDFPDVTEPTFVEDSGDDDDVDSAFFVRGGKRRSVKESVTSIETRDEPKSPAALSFQAPSLRARLRSLQESDEPAKTEDVNLTSFRPLLERLQELEQWKERPIERQRVQHATSFSSADSVSSWGEEGESESGSRRSSSNSSLLGRFSLSFDSSVPTRSSSKSSVSTQEADGSLAVEFKSLRQRFEELERAISKPVPRCVDPVKELQVYKRSGRVSSKSTSN